VVSKGAGLAGIAVYDVMQKDPARGSQLQQRSEYAGAMLLPTPQAVLDAVEAVLLGERRYGTIISPSGSISSLSLNRTRRSGPRLPRFVRNCFIRNRSLRIHRSCRACCS
jgi:hypothetical protein